MCTVRTRKLVRPDQGMYMTKRIGFRSYDTAGIGGGVANTMMNIFILTYCAN